MTENEALKNFENEVVILDCWIENDKDIIANCDTEDDEFDDDKELAELSLKDYSERKELFETAISALKEIQQYREIGTVEECRKAVEKQKPQKPKDSLKIDPVIDENGAYVDADTTVYLLCPNCREMVGIEDNCDRFCHECGQAIDNENLEGMEDVTSEM